MTQVSAEFTDQVSLQLVAINDGLQEDKHVHNFAIKVGSVQLLC